MYSSLEKLVTTDVNSQSGSHCQVHGFEIDISRIITPPQRPLLYIESCCLQETRVESAIFSDFSTELGLSPDFTTTKLSRFLSFVSFDCPYCRSNRLRTMTCGISRLFKFEFEFFVAFVVAPIFITLGATIWDTRICGSPIGTTSYPRLESLADASTCRVHHKVI